jgi:GNAT superfamily N-acetyltransferase
VAGLELGPGQEKFVGNPLRMALAGLAEESRRPYVIESNGKAVGVLTLQSGAARLAGWPDDNSAWLLRGFLIDRRQQGKGYGPLGAAAAVAAAEQLTRRHRTGEAGVVLSVNEANPAGLSAYRRAGFEDLGQYLGGSAGPQRMMFHRFAGAGGP